MSDEGFAPPPFKPDEALEKLKRSLRDLKLSERGSGFELRGKRVVELGADAGGITARLARRPALTPAWDTHTVRSGAELRKLQDEIRKRLARWESEE